MLKKIRSDYVKLSERAQEKEGRRLSKLVDWNRIGTTVESYKKKLEEIDKDDLEELNELDNKFFCEIANEIEEKTGLCMLTLESGEALENGEHYTCLVEDEKIGFYHEVYLDKPESETETFLSKFFLWSCKKIGFMC